MRELNWEQVRDRSQAVLALDPNNQDALTFLAAAERALGGSTAPTTVTHTAPTLTTTPATTPDQPTSFANGRYQVKRFLGEGGKKKVYLAHDTTLDREVAFALIKTDGLDETSRTWKREAQAMGRLGSYSHIVTVFDLGEEQDQPYMVTELMGGGDVEGHIEKAEDHRLPLEQAIKIAQETCRGMEFAHSRGIVHRDLKPGNVWLTAEGVAKIGDFGIALAVSEASDQRLTETGLSIGTPHYMSPEQAQGKTVDARSDIFSLGIIFYEMIHEARVIPVDDRPALSDNIRLWNGDPRGRWEGDTLIVETRYFNNWQSMRGAPAENLTLIESFRRDSDNKMIYGFTVDDPSVFTAQFSGEYPLSRINERIYEYACHEGNYGMVGILAGARRLESLGIEP